MLTRMNHIVPTVLALVLVPLTGMAQEGGRSEEMVQPKMRAWDEGGFKPHVGIGAGYLDARDDVTTQDASFMVDAGFQVRPLELSGQFQYTPGSLKIGGQKSNFNVTDILLKAALVVGGDVPLLRDMYVGAKSGAVLHTLEEETTTYFAVGPTAGFDIPLDVENTFSLGAEGTYLALIRDNVPNQVSVLGSMKYWF